MRDLIYQIPGDLSAGPLGSRELARRQSLLESWALGGSKIRVFDSPGGPLSIESAAEESLCVAPMLKALQALTSPPAAVVIGCYGDPGLAALREVMDCPVVGPLESSFHLGLQLGRRLGIVTVVDEVIPLLDQLVRSMGLEGHYAGSVAVDIPVLDLAGQKERAVEAAFSGAHELLARGADVISLGCMSMAFQGVAEVLRPRFQVPVINPARSALNTAEMLIALQLKSSRAAYPRPRKSILV